jgi:Arc/MetJ-type ribon-helix-helix transcriptional regulator
MATEKVTVALSPAVVRRAKKAVKEGRAKSLSALVNAVLEEQLRRDELNELFDQWDAERGPPTKDDEEWAARVLGR